MLLGKKIQHSKIIRVDLNILAVAVSKIFALLVLYPNDFECYSVVQNRKRDEIKRQSTRKFKSTRVDFTRSMFFQNSIKVQSPPLL